MTKKHDTELPTEQEWIEVFPFGVTLAADEIRPIMVFRDATEKLTLPVWLSPLDAGISLSQEFQSSIPATPHRLTNKMLGRLGLSLEECFFVEINGHSQIVELKFGSSGPIQMKNLRHRAEESISFCLFAKAKFFAPRWFIQKSRELKSDLQSVQQGLNLDPGVARNEHPYMM